MKKRKAVKVAGGIMLAAIVAGGLTFRGLEVNRVPARITVNGKVDVGARLYRKTHGYYVAISEDTLFHTNYRHIYVFVPIGLKGRPYVGDCSSDNHPDRFFYEFPSLALTYGMIGPQVNGVKMGIRQQITVSHDAFSFVSSEGEKIDVRLLEHESDADRNP